MKIFARKKLHLSILLVMVALLINILHAEPTIVRGSDVGEGTNWFNIALIDVEDFTMEMVDWINTHQESERLKCVVVPGGHYTSEVNEIKIPVVRVLGNGSHTYEIEGTSWQFICLDFNYVPVEEHHFGNEDYRYRVVFDDTYYTGTNEEIIGDDPWLGNNTIGNDNISSFHYSILPTDPPAMVRFYEDSEYSSALDVISNISDLDDFGGDDKHSSIKVNAGFVNGIILYDYVNYGGTCETLITDQSDLGGGVVGNDDASSIKLIGWANCRLYQDKDYGDPHIDIDEDTPDLGAWSNRASSLMWLDQDYSSGVILYRDNTYSGKYETFLSDDLNLRYGKGSHVGNDEVSSVMLVNSGFCTLYKHSSYVGEFTTNQNHPDLSTVRGGLDDEISSWKWPFTDIWDSDFDSDIVDEYTFNWLKKQLHIASSTNRKIVIFSQSLLNEVQDDDRCKLLTSLLNQYNGHLVGWFAKTKLNHAKQPFQSTSDISSLTTGYFRDTEEQRVNNIKLVRMRFDIKNTQPQQSKNHVLRLLNVSQSTIKDEFSISLNLKHAVNVRLQLVDVSGRVVKTICSAYENSGRHDYNVNVCNLSRGIYFINLDTGDHHEVQKIIIAR